MALAGPDTPSSMPAASRATMQTFLNFCALFFAFMKNLRSLLLVLRAVACGKEAGQAGLRLTTPPRKTVLPGKTGAPSR